jgi:hypothetical protein
MPSRTAGRTKAACTSNPAWASATAACPSSTSPPASSRCSTKTARWSWFSTARSTTIRTSSRNCRPWATYLPHQERHGVHRARLGILGRGLRAALPRHVRLRPVGPQASRCSSWRGTGWGSSPCTTPCWTTARCCSGPSSRPSLAHGPACAATWTRGGGGLLRPGLRARAAHHLQAALKAAPRSHLLIRRGQPCRPAEEYWDVRFTPLATP